MNSIFQRVEANVAMSVTDLKKNTNAAFSMAKSQAVAVLNHSRVVGYIISPEAYDGFLEMAEDLHDLEEIERTKDDELIPVDINDL